MLIQNLNEESEEVVAGLLLVAFQCFWFKRLYLLRVFVTIDISVHRHIGSFSLSDKEMVILFRVLVKILFTPTSPLVGCHITSTVII